MPLLRRRSGELLLRILDQSVPVVARAALDEPLLEVATVLLAVGALKPHTPARAAFVTDDEGLQYVDLVWCSERGAYGYFDAADGYVLLAPDAPARYGVNLDWWLTWLSSALDLMNGARPAELVPGHAWDIGDLWITRQRKVPVVFARRLHLNAPLDALQSALTRRAGRSGGIVLTSSRRPLKMAIEQPSFQITPIGEILTTDADSFAVDRALLMSPYVVLRSDCSEVEPLYLSPDGRQLVINGSVTINFSSHIQISIIRRLVDGHCAGRKFRARDLLAEVHSGATSLRRAFGAKKWALLEPFLKSRDGFWGFEL